MLNETTMEEWLRDRGVALAKPIIKNEGSTAEYYAFVESALSKDGKRKPTSFALSQISKEAIQSGFQISFVLVNDSENDIDGSLKTMLTKKYPDLVRNSFLSTADRNAHIWIEPKHPISEETRKNVEADIQTLLGLLNINQCVVSFLGDVNTPTPTAILRTMRTISPCSLTDVEKTLVQKGFSVPNSVWLNHAIDRLRRSGAILRKGNRTYILTLKGLSALGTEKNRRSPDIVRALALAHARA